MAKIQWISVPNVSEDQRAANSLVIASLGLPEHRGSGRLAVVGGGPSINDHIEELQNWDGQIWAVNGTINWCKDHGIDAWFYTADSSPAELWPHNLTRITKAVVVPDCSPSMIEHLKRLGAEITLSAPLESGPTSVNASDFLAIAAGYSHVTYFGAEGSFLPSGTHGFAAYAVPDWVEAVVGGEHFRTKAEFISQSIMLANTINAFPTIYAEKSGGLLRAMIEHGPDYDVYMVSNELYEKLKPAA